MAVNGTLTGSHIPDHLKRLFTQDQFHYRTQTLVFNFIRRGFLHKINFTIAHNTLYSPPMVAAAYAVSFITQGYLHKINVTSSL